MAQALRGRLTSEQAIAALALSQAEADAINKIASGRPMRNALAVLRAIETKLAYTVAKPKQEVGVSGGVVVTFEINTGKGA